MDKTDIVWHEPSVSRLEREQRHRQQGCVVWFTGLSGSGKSTIANAVDRQLFEQGLWSFVLDGDNVRHGLNASPALLAPYGEEFARRFGLTFAAPDRQENIRRIGAVADLFASAGLTNAVSVISPAEATRSATAPMRRIFSCRSWGANVKPKRRANSSPYAASSAGDAFRPCRTLSPSSR